MFPDNDVLGQMDPYFAICRAVLHSGLKKFVAVPDCIVVQSNSQLLGVPFALHATKGQVSSVNQFTELSWQKQ